MPNRIIKESICTSENLDKLSSDAEVFFYRLVVVCDDYGIMFATPSILRSKCYPLKIDKVKDRDIEKWIKELCESELIFLYSYDGRTYLKFTKWNIHQQVRANKSKFPTPDSEGVQLISIDIKSLQMKSNAPVIESVIDNSNRDKIIDTYTTDIDLKQSILDFIEMRKQKKKPVSEKALVLIFKELDKLSKTDQDKIDILNQSIMNSWQGIFELKGGFKGGQVKTGTGTGSKDKKNTGSKLPSSIYAEGCGPDD